MSSRKATAASVLCKIIIINFRLVVVQHLLQFSAVVPTVTAFHPSVGLSNPTHFPTRVRRTPSIISSSIIRSYQHRSSQSTSSIVGTRDHSSILVSSQQWATTTSRLFASSSSSSDINMLHYNSIGSTQDEVRQILGDESRHGKQQQQHYFSLQSTVGTSFLPLTCLLIVSFSFVLRQFLNL